jgi:hypothetical protein
MIENEKIGEKDIMRMGIVGKKKVVDGNVFNVPKKT